MSIPEQPIEQDNDVQSDQSDDGEISQMHRQDFDEVMDFLDWLQDMCQ